MVAVCKVVLFTNESPFSERSDDVPHPWGESVGCLQDSRIFGSDGSLMVLRSLNPSEKHQYSNDV